MRVGVLASGEGTNLQALLDTVHGSAVEVVAVAADQPGARALDRAERAGVATRVFERGAFAGRPARDAAIADWLEERDVGLVVLAGYMAILDDAFLTRFAGRIAASTSAGETASGTSAAACRITGPLSTSPGSTKWTVTPKTFAP